MRAVRRRLEPTVEELLAGRRSSRPPSTWTVGSERGPSSTTRASAWIVSGSRREPTPRSIWCARCSPIIDDFGRASDNVPDAIAADAWFEGIGLVQRKLLALLEKSHIEPISTVGQPFDPNIHEAVTQEPSDVFESGIVTRELQAGYRLGDRVIRAALVCVAL